MTDELEAAQDRLSQKLGVRCDLDDDFVTVAAFVAHDAIVQRGGPDVRMDVLRDEVRDWLGDEYE